MEDVSVEIEVLDDSDNADDVDGERLQGEELDEIEEDPVLARRPLPWYR